METPVNFYLSSLEEQVRIEFCDEVKLTQSSTEGKLHLVIQEDALANFLDLLQEKRGNTDWTQGRQNLQKEISGLKAQLRLAQAELSSSPVSDLKAQLDKTSMLLRDTKKDLEQHTKINEDLRAEPEQVKAAYKGLHNELSAVTQVECKTAQAQEQQKLLTAISNLHIQLEHMKGEKKALDRELDEKRSYLRTNTKLLAEAKTNMDLVNQLKFGQVEARQCLEHQANIIRHMQFRLGQAEEEKQAFHRELAAVRFELSRNKELLSLAGTNAELELERAQTQERHELAMSTIRFLEDQLEKVMEEKEALQSKIEEMKCETAEVTLMFNHKKDIIEVLENDLAFERTLLKNLRQEVSRDDKALWKEREEAKKVAAALKKAQDELEMDRLSFQQETEKIRASCQTQVDRAEEEKIKLMAAVKEAEQELNSKLLQWHQEKSALTAHMEKLRETHFAELRTQENNNNILVSTLKAKFGDKLQSDYLQWQQEKMSLLQETQRAKATYEAQLGDHEQGNNTLKAALTKAEQELLSHRNMWQEEKNSLLQATKSLKETLQEKEQAEGSLTSQLAELQS